MDVMVDLETLGKGSHAAIIAIGAIEFDRTNKTLGRCFYKVVDPQTSVDAGLKVDVSTIMWWMQQDVAAKRAFTEPGCSLKSALTAFSAWYPQGACLWGNGAVFDNTILGNAYDLLGLERPWKYSADRCYRTLKALNPSIKANYSGVAHNALDDAKNQAFHAIQILNK